MNDYLCFRIPAIIKAPDNSLLAFAEARKKNSADSGDIDLVMRKSTDWGNTWSPIQIIWDDGENTCGNPSPVVDLTTGRIWLFLTWNDGRDIEKNIENRRSHNTRRVYVLFSDDSGQSWSKPVDMTTSVKFPEWTWYATGPCHGIQKSKLPHKNRLIIPANHKKIVNEAGNVSVKSYSHVIYSDDNGASWHIGGTVYPDGGNESSVVELSDGRVMLNMRSYHKTDSCRSMAISENAGITWSKRRMQKELIEPRCQGSILSYSSDSLLNELYFSNPHSFNRNNLSILRSLDNGESWSLLSVVEKNSAAYSDMVLLNNDTIGILYECGSLKEKYNTICFQIIPINH